MTVYNVNLGIGWASSGVEYAQKYRAAIFKKLNVPAKFIFSDLILNNNIEDLTKNMDFDDDQIIWFYNFFTDVKIAPSSYTLAQLEKDLNLNSRKVKSKDKLNDQVTYLLPDENLSIVARLRDEKKSTIDQVTYLRDGKMLKRDFYSYTKYACEYYSGTQNSYVALREFYNEDGSVAYTQHLNGSKEMFEFPDHRIFYSKTELYCEMIKQLHLTKDDLVIMDREDEDKNLINSQPIFEMHRPAKLLVVVHADHYSKEFTTPRSILWNNFYEYQFTHSKEVDAFIVATPKQRDVLKEQLKKYFHTEPRVSCIPVGNIPELVPKSADYKPFSLITASRLASEKHVDWLVKAVIDAKKQVPQLTFDIYGRGGESSTLSEIIKKNKAESYIRLMGQHDLSKVYAKYSAYIAASTSEGFGLSLMEAVGSGLPMIGFDVPYGNPTFIDNNQNGYLLPYDNDWEEKKKIAELSSAIVKLFTENKVEPFSKHSYEIAKNYLIDSVALKWKNELEDLKND